MKILKEVKKYSLIVIALSLVIGLLFVIFPAQCIKYTAIIIGVAFILMGIASIISYCVNKSSGFTLALGIITAIVGAIICAKYKSIISIIVIICGIFILATGIFNFITSIKVVVSHLFSGWFTMAMAIATMVFGIVAISKSSQLTEAIVQLIGVALLVYAVMDIVAYVQVKKLTKDVGNAFNKTSDIETDATIIEESDD
jgi:uncharacterized membrane protein HdeD (DUF308 family)